MIYAWPWLIAMGLLATTQLLSSIDCAAARIITTRTCLIVNIVQNDLAASL